MPQALPTCSRQCRIVAIIAHRVTVAKSPPVTPYRCRRRPRRRRTEIEATAAAAAAVAAPRQAGVDAAGTSRSSHLARHGVRHPWSRWPHRRQSRQRPQEPTVGRQMGVGATTGIGGTTARRRTRRQVEATAAVAAAAGVQHHPAVAATQIPRVTERRLVPAAVSRGPSHLIYGRGLIQMRREAAAPARNRGATLSPARTLRAPHLPQPPHLGDRMRAVL